MRKGGYEFVYRAIDKTPKGFACGFSNFRAYRKLT